MKKTCISKDWYLSVDGRYKNKKVDLPNDYSITLPRSKDAQGGASNGFFQSGVGKYVKYFTVDENAKSVILDVDGAYMCASVTVNEHYLTMHPHGYVPFTVDLSKDIIKGITNKLKIVTNALQPSTRWYSGAGLYRDVFLWTGGDIRIEPRDIFIKTPATDSVKAEITVTADKSADVTVVCSIVDKDGSTVLSSEKSVSIDSKKTDLTFDFKVKNAKLWDTETPYLYTLKTEIIQNGAVVDTDCRKFGIRTISADSTNGFLLNGKPLNLKGGCIHHDHGVLGAAEYPAACRRKLLNLKNAGFNAIRSAHNPPSTVMLELCDELGIVIMDEFFDCWQIIKGGNLNYHLFFNDHWERDIESAVLRDRNHPSVISYSIGNEIPEAAGWEGTYEWVTKLADKTRSIDDTRLMTTAVYNMRVNHADTDPDDYVEYFNNKYLSSSYEENIDMRTPNWADRTEKHFAPLDICGYNYLYRRYEPDHERFPKRVIWGSETHALTFFDSWQKVKDLPYVIGDFTWTAHDNLGEAGTGRGVWARDGYMDSISLADYPWRSCWQGDFDLCGHRRPQSYFREAVWSDKGIAPVKIFTTHPEHYGEGYSGTKWHWYDVHDTWTFDESYIGSPVKCEVYTTCDEVEWILNGKTVGKSAPEKAIATMDIPYEKGTLTAVCYADGKECGRDSIVTVGAPAKITVTPEHDSFKADGRDLCYFEIQLVDKDGNRITDATDEISCIVDGCELLGVFSGDPKNEDRYGDNRCHLFEGRAVAIVRAYDKGEVTIRVGAKKVQSGTAVVLAK